VRRPHGVAGAERLALDGDLDVVEGVRRRQASTTTTTRSAPASRAAITQSTTWRPSST
jgi:hypothetical protein